MRKPTFNRFYSNSLDKISLAYPFTISFSHFLQAGQHYKGKGTSPISVDRSPTSLPPWHHSPHSSPTSHLSPIKLISMPRRNIPHHRALLEECFPCVLWNILSLHSPCSSFATAATHPSNTNPLMIWHTLWITYKTHLRHICIWYLHRCICWKFCRCWRQYSPSPTRMAHWTLCSLPPPADVLATATVSTRCHFLILRHQYLGGG